MICIYRYFSLICKFIYVSVCSSEAVLKCPVTYIPVPVVDVRVTDEDAAKIERSKSKFWGQQKKREREKEKSGRNLQRKTQRRRKLDTCSGRFSTLPCFLSPWFERKHLSYFRHLALTGLIFGHGPKKKIGGCSIQSTT